MRPRRPTRHDETPPAPRHHVGHFIDWYLNTHRHTIGKNSVAHCSLLGLHQKRRQTSRRDFYRNLTAAARIVNGTKTYGDGDAAVTALHEVNVEFGSARFTAIMGPSGSGKSTLMHCIAGLDRLTSGEAFIGDTLLADLKDKKLTELRRSEVGFIFQSFNLVPTLTAEENINLPMSLGGRNGDREWIDTVIDTVGLRDRLSHRPSELSGGQQQRVAVARACKSADDHLRRRTDRQP